MPRFLGWPDPGLTFDVALHVGTLGAVVAYFWRDWLALLRAAPHPRTPDGRLCWLLLLGAIHNVRLPEEAAIRRAIDDYYQQQPDEEESGDPGVGDGSDKYLM